MRKQARQVYEYLKAAGADTDSNMSCALGIPAASVRRSIQELIHSGVNITYAGSTTGLYTLSR